MEDDSQRFEDVSTTEAFEMTITQLLEAAHENGVPVTRSVEVRNGDDIPDWEVMIVELSSEASD